MAATSGAAWYGHGMRRTGVFFIGMMLLGCGKSAAPVPPPPPVATAPAEPPRPVVDEAKVAALQERQGALERRVAECDRALSELAARQNREREELGDMSAEKSRFRSVNIEARKLRGEIEYGDAELAKLKTVAEGTQHPKLLELRKELRRLDSEIDQAISVRREEQARIGQGAVDEAPVAREIRALRAVQERWFDATIEVRARAPQAAQRKQVNDAYLAWLKEKPERAAIVTKVLAQPLAGKGLTPERYDYTNLSFFVLCQTLEHELDKQNIDVERKERGELRQRVEGLERDRDKVLEQVDAIQNSEGGEDLRRYDDMVKFVQSRRSTLEKILGQIEVLSERLRRDTDLRARHDMESADAEKSLQQAKEELAAVRRELRALGK